MSSTPEHDRGGSGYVSRIERRTTLPMETASVRLARTFVVRAIEQWTPNVDADMVALATSEVVTNALTHAGGDVTLTVRLDDGTLRVEVGDTSGTLPVVGPFTPDATSGRGMYIVDSVADAWGVDQVPDDGKVVWFAMASRPDVLSG